MLIKHLTIPHPFSRTFLHQSKGDSTPSPSSGDMFGGAKDEYEKALKDAGHTEIFQYDSKVTRGCRPKRKRSRCIIWFNPPYSKSVATNIGKEFLKLLRVHFLKQHPLHRIFNDNTVKLSYSTISLSINSM